MILCPKCGFEQPKDGFCAKCGVMIDSFVSKKPPLLSRPSTAPLCYGIMVLIIGGGIFTVISQRPAQDELRSTQEALSLKVSNVSDMAPPVSTAQKSVPSPAPQAPP